MRKNGCARKDASGLNDLSPFGTPKDIIRQTTFADGEVKKGDAAKNGETAKKRIYAKGKYFAPD